MKSLKQFFKKLDFIKVAQIVVMVALFLAPLTAVHALTAPPCPTGINCSAGTSVTSLISTVINWLLGIAFGVAVLFLIIGGFWYITSAGNEEQSDKGRKTILNAIIGIIIIVLSYVIVNVVSNFASGAGSSGAGP